MKLDLDLLTRAVKAREKRGPSKPSDASSASKALDLDALIARVRAQRQKPRPRRQVAPQALRRAPQQAARQAPRQAPRQVQGQPYDPHPKIPREHKPPSSNFFGWIQPLTKAQQQAREKNWLAEQQRDEVVREHFRVLEQHGWPLPLREARLAMRPDDWLFDLQEFYYQIVDMERMRREIIARIEDKTLVSPRTSPAKAAERLKIAKHEVARARETIESWLASTELAFGQPGLDEMTYRLTEDDAWPLAENP